MSVVARPVAMVAKQGTHCLARTAPSAWTRSHSIHSIAQRGFHSKSRTLIPLGQHLGQRSGSSFLRTLNHNLTSPASAAQLYRRAMSTQTTPANAAVAAEQEDPIQGSAPIHERQFLICTGIPSEKWVKKPEMSDPYLNLLLTETRSQGVSVALTDEVSQVQEHQPTSALPSKGPRHDLILFPDNVKFRGLRYEAFKDLGRYLAQHPRGTLRPLIEKAIAEAPRTENGDTSSLWTELVPGSGEKVEIELVQEPGAVLVCVHGSRDCRCGEQGGQLRQILKDMVQQTGLSNSIKIYGVSHIGGHKFAPNTIMYPSGDWHGRISVLDSVDAQQILFDALSTAISGSVRERPSDPIMIEKWRGRLGMSKQDQLALYERVMSKNKKPTAVVTETKMEETKPQSLFSAPGEDLYQEDGLQERANAVSVEANKPSEPAAAAVSPEAASASSVKIIFETYQKVRTEIEAKVGERILDIVKDKDPSRHGVYQALECTCGGQLECATCHVYIEPPFGARLPAITDAEEDMLEYAVGRNEETSRLGCQVRIKPELEGMVVKLPRY